MCHAVRIRISESERKEVRRLSGLLIPVYASIVLLLIAATSVMHLPSAQDGVAIAKNSAPAADAR